MVLYPDNLRLLPAFVVRYLSTFHAAEYERYLAIFANANHAIRTDIELVQRFTLDERADIDCFL